MTVGETPGGCQAYRIDAFMALDESFSNSRVPHVRCSLFVSFPSQPSHRPTAPLIAPFLACPCGSSPLTPSLSAKAKQKEKGVVGRSRRRHIAPQLTAMLARLGMHCSRHRWSRPTMPMGSLPAAWRRVAAMGCSDDVGFSCRKRNNVCACREQ